MELWKKRIDKRINKLINICGDNRGSMTVEASFIVPIILVLLMGIIFITLFYLDMMSAKSESMKVANRVSRIWKVDGTIESGEFQKDKLLSRSTYFLLTPNNSSAKSKGESYLQEHLKEKLTVTKLKSASISISGYRVKAKVVLGFRWPLSILGTYFGSGGLSFTGNSEMCADYREELLRLAGVN